MFSKAKFTMANEWMHVENDWNEKFKWFLIDEGKIHYAFKSKLEARMFKGEFYLNYMFLTDLENIIPKTMIDPHEYRSWINKEPKCIYKESPFK